MFGQVFEFHDLFLIGLLVVLEGILSIDNALVLGILAKRLPKHQQKKALTYGLVGAFIFRFIAIGAAAYLMHWILVKLLGGAYLVYIAIKHFLFEEKHDASELVPLAEAEAEPTEPEIARPAVATAPVIDTRKYASFWPTVLVIELTDIAFAVDSILAALGVIPTHTDKETINPKFWVVLTGGFLGVIMMRFAAILFIRLLEKFPRFGEAAYLLVLLIGAKLVIDWAAHRYAWSGFNFHSPSTMAFWVFWVAMVGAFCTGFLPQRRKSAPDSTIG